MSKDISIAEGGAPRQFSGVKALVTGKVGGGTVRWVPEDEVRLAAKHITANGAYAAEDDGCYGYSSVTVSGIGRAAGTDDDGDDAVVTEDKGTGKLVVTKIPSAIELVTPPDRTSYAEGDPLSFTGISVRARLRSGGVFTDETYPDGMIPLRELVFPVWIAPAGGSGISGVPTLAHMQTNEALARGTPQFSVQEGPHRGGTLLAGCTPSVVMSWFWYGNRRVDVSTGRDGIYWQGYTADSVRASFSTSGWTQYEGICYRDWNMGEFTSWTKLGGLTFSTLQEGLAYMAAHMVSGTAAIPVQWTSPYNGKTLETSFAITVTGGSGT